MEHLNKSQIVLLTLFVSFVASMATGIVVVTLMQQSPEPVTQTLTRVVERTIEKITPGPVVEKSTTKTVVMKDEDLMVAAIERNIKSTVAFRVVGQDGESRSSGVGTIVSVDGLVVTDKGNFGEGVLTTTVGGVQYALQVLSNEKGNTLGLGRLTPVSASTTASFIPVTLGNPDALKLGQTAIVIGGRDGKTITTGLISSLDTHTVTNKGTSSLRPSRVPHDTKSADSSADSETKVLDSIGVSTRFSGSSNGAPIITLSGEVVGFLSIDENVGSQVGVPATEARGLLGTVK